MIKLDKGTKFAFILVGILIIVIAVLCITKFFSINDITKICLSLCAGLIGWVFTNSFTSWLNRDKEDHLLRIGDDFREYSESKFFPHCMRTNQAVDHILKKNRIIVVHEERKNIGYEFLLPVFKNARTVKISGIACTDLIRELVEKPDHALLKALRANNDIKIDILINDPDAAHIKYRDSLECRSKVDPTPCSTGIKNSIMNIIKLGVMLENAASIKPQPNSVLQIRKTKIPLSNTLNYVEYYEPKFHHNKQQLFVGLLFPHLEGYNSLLFEVSEIDEENNRNLLFDFAIKSFERVFEDCIGPESPTKNLLTWDITGIKPNKELLEKQT